jgi:hypothetical protein
MESVSKLEELIDLPRAQLIREHERMRTTLANIHEVAFRSNFSHYTDLKMICNMVEAVNKTR